MNRTATIIGLAAAMLLVGFSDERLAPGSAQAQVQPRPPATATPRREPQADLRIQAFFGSFSGSGLAETEGSAYFGVTLRDLDVKISAAPGDGFVIAWTTVLRQGGNPAQPNVRKRAASLTFVPGPRPGQFRGADSGDPLAGKPLSWARIERNTLFIYEMAVLPDGRYDLQTYSRTLSGNGMQLVYNRVTDGERMRTVKGRLVKQAS